uniref:Uncharacterized protein n=1 Tax=Manihot esculenta TaxID=3983 RepID=A0A2C9V0B3_MANES
MITINKRDFRIFCCIKLDSVCLKSLGSERIRIIVE